MSTSSEQKLWSVGIRPDGCETLIWMMHAALRTGCTDSNNVSSKNTRDGGSSRVEDYIELTELGKMHRQKSPCAHARF
jgi:hypothetical protein